MSPSDEPTRPQSETKAGLSGNLIRMFRVKSLFPIIGSMVILIGLLAVFGGEFRLEGSICAAIGAVWTALALMGRKRCLVRTDSIAIISLFSNQQFLWDDVTEIIYMKTNARWTPWSALQIKFSPPLPIMIFNNAGIHHFDAFVNLLQEIAKTRNILWKELVQ